MDLTLPGKRAVLKTFPFQYIEMHRLKGQFLKTCPFAWPELQIAIPIKDLRFEANLPVRHVII